MVLLILASGKETGRRKISIVRECLREPVSNFEGLVQVLMYAYSI